MALVPRRNRLRRPVPAEGEHAVFYRASTMEVVERHATEHPPVKKRHTKMARFVGTGTAPDGLLVEGTIVDIPDDSDRAREVVEKGWATPLEAADDPSRTPLQIAQALLRNDPFVLDADAEVAASMSLEDARAKVHLQDSNATAADLEAVEAEFRKTQLGPGQRLGEPASGLTARASEDDDAPTGEPVEQPSTEERRAAGNPQGATGGESAKATAGDQKTGQSTSTQAKKS